MLTVDMENKENGSLDVKNSVENGRPPDPADWAVRDVVNYFRTAGFEEQASAFQEQSLPCAHCATHGDDCDLSVVQPYSAAASLLPSPVGSRDFLQE